MESNKFNVQKSDLIVETARLLIRPFEKQDILGSYKMNLDEAVSRYTGDGGVVSEKENERRIIEDVFGDYEKYGFGRLAVEWKATKEFIGFTGFKYIKEWDVVDLGYRFMSKYWGRGIATESGKAMLELGFGILNFEKIIATVLPENTNSIKVCNKLGFNFEKNIIEDGMEIKLFTIHKADYQKVEK